MNNRQKWMLGGLALVVSLWQGPGLVNQLVFAPVTSREESIDKLKESIDKKENERRRQRRAQKQLAEMAKRSLPPDPVIAAQVFQNWLYETAASARLSSVVVDKPRADNLKRESTYFVVHGQIKGQATLSQVCNLLYEFDRSGLLLKVASVRLEAPRRDPDPALKVEISVDALALLASPSRKTLWVGDDPPGPMPGTKLAELDSFEPISMKNLFVRGYSGPPAPPAPPPTAPPPPPAAPSTAEFTYLVALVGRNGVYNATLFDRSSNKESVLRIGTEFKAGGYEGKVVAIAERSITLLVGEDQFLLELGKNMKQMQKLPRADAGQGT